MHNTTLDLGPYASDPRLKVAPHDGGHLIQISSPSATISVSPGSRAQVWRHPDDGSEGGYLASLESSAVDAIAFVLGDPIEVGPDGMGGWVHTDGVTYLHDPATSAYKPATSIRIGDVIAYAGRPEVEILELEHFSDDFFGRQMNGFWGRRLDTGQEGVVPFGPGGSFPVKFRN